MASGIKVSAPATISNINCGFDVLGMALDLTCDEIVGRLEDKPGVQLELRGKFARATPADPSKNTAGVAVDRFLEFLGLKDKVGIHLRLQKTINPGSGLGSSAASACAAVVLANELLDRPMEKRDLLPFAVLGEYAADHAFHADNVAPCLIGGAVMIRDLMLLDIHRLYIPKGLMVTVATPHVRVLTEEARGVLKKEVPLRSMIRQTANISAFTHAMHTSDFELLSRSLQDHVIEDQRAHLIPHFYEVKDTIMTTGALGFGISGSGPTLFAISNNENVAHECAQQMERMYQGKKIECKTHVSYINPAGTVLC